MRVGAMSGATSIRGILFDKDGTLLDYQASWAPLNLHPLSHRLLPSIAALEQVLFG